MISLAAFDISQYVRVVSLLQDSVEGFRGRIGVTDPFNLQPPPPANLLSTNDALDLVCLLGVLLPQVPAHGVNKLGRRGDAIGGLVTKLW